MTKGCEGFGYGSVSLEIWVLVETLVVSGIVLAQRLHLWWVCRPAIGFQDLKIWKILSVGGASGVSRRAGIYGGSG
ncbi:hypothetical protein NC653_028993 [Populus alba x Populus x berolinensis]|uniref:Uncharacterized protein n=1 Tax=Populus alba x Populus x berolinensis TaxID=444605 RepID=A0AAD6M1D4_9ROSI|nr:hypothetical protein NC653_028993 [Populus alba x Populus x berolinensis]